MVGTEFLFPIEEDDMSQRLEEARVEEREEDEKTSDLKRTFEQAGLKIEVIDSGQFGQVKNDEVVDPPPAKKARTGERSNSSQEAQNLDGEERLSVDDPRYVRCKEGYNQKTQWYQPKGKVWLVNCYICREAVHLPYDPNLKRYADVAGWCHADHERYQ